MTALNVFVRPDAVYMAADGAGFKGKNLHCLSAKLLPIPHLNAVVGIRGSAAGAQQIWTHVATSFDTYDQMRANVADSLKQAFRIRSKLFRALFEFELIVGGIDGQGTPRAFMLCSHSRNDGVPAWTVKDVRVLLTPSYDQHGTLQRMVADDSIPIEDIALKALEQQRARPMVNIFGKAVYGVGGYAQLATIKPNDISITILKRWNDQLGKPVDPKADRGVVINFDPFQGTGGGSFAQDLS